jgi:hypothetical protein
MLRLPAHPEVVDYPEGGRIDDIDSIADGVWNINARWEGFHRRVKKSGARFRVNILRIEYGRHSRKGRLIGRKGR